MAAVGNDDACSGDDADVNTAIDTDAELQQIATRLENDLVITPDTDLHVDPSDVVPPDSDSSNNSSIKDGDEFGDSSDDSTKPKLLIKNGHLKKSDKVFQNGLVKHGDSFLKPDVSSLRRKPVAEDKSRDSSDTESLKSRHGCTPGLRKNPLKMLKKLTKFDKPNRKSDFTSQFTVVTVDRLPQVFVVKYLGHRDITGASGLHHVRKPVDEMVQQIRTKLDAKEELNLPLLYVIISPKGLDLREHRSNKVKGTAPLGLIPISFISYGVQDIKYWRVFTCIIIKAISWQTRSATCHAFLCDSSHNGRKMALSLGAAFNQYSKKLEADGASSNFKVELRPPDELADGMQECDV
ncbi:hypothetical protein BsWGS_25328 [Bradybaena similaris]